MEWFSPEEMHEHTKKWVSELLFIKDEQHFLKNLIQSFALKTLDKKQFERIDDFNLAIKENERALNLLLPQIKKHMNLLGIMLDGINQLEMEKAYKRTHKNLFQKMNKFRIEYRTVKERGFIKLSDILKKDKQKIALGNPEYKLRSL